MSKILILLVSFYFFSFSNLFTKELIIDIFGKEKIKTFEIDKNNFFRIVSTNSVFTTNTNIYGNNECAGTTEIYKKQVYLNIICELREKKNKAFYILKTDNSQSSKKSEVTELMIKAMFVGGTGRWKDLKGKECNFVYFEFDEGASHSKIKCTLDEKTFLIFNSK